MSKLTPEQKARRTKQLQILWRENNPDILAKQKALRKIRRVTNKIKASLLTRQIPKKYKEDFESLYACPNSFWANDTRIGWNFEYLKTVPHDHLTIRYWKRQNNHKPKGLGSGYSEQRALEQRRFDRITRNKRQATKRKEWLNFYKTMKYNED